MRLAMFGVTGTCGAPLLDAALADRHQVSVLVRDVRRLSGDRTRLTVTEGDALDADAVANTVAGADVVLSTLGGLRGPESLSVGTRNIVAAMHRYAVRRLVVVQGFHLRFPGDPRNVGQRMIGGIMRTVGRDIFRHSTIMAELLAGDDLDWTLVRIPRVTRAAATGSVRLGRQRLGPWHHVTTGDVAAVVLRLAATSQYLRQAPMLASGRPVATASAADRALPAPPLPDRAGTQADGE